MQLLPFHKKTSSPKMAKSSDNKGNKKDKGMDKFMDDFLEGKFRKTISSGISHHKMTRSHSRSEEMDKFMTDFLEGKYLEEKRSDGDASTPPPAEVSVVARRGVRRSKSGETCRRPTAKAADMAPTADSPSAPGAAAATRRGVRRCKSGESYQRPSSSSSPSDPAAAPANRRSTGAAKNKQLLDPQMVLRMLELYADLEDNEKAHAMLHYNRKGGRAATKNVNKGDDHVDMKKINSASMAA